MTAAGPRWRLVRAGTDAVPAWVRRFFATGSPGRAGGPERPDAALRRRRQLWIGAVAAAALVMVWVLWATPVLSVRQVRVTGTEVLTEAQVRQAAAVPERTPLLRVRRGEVAGRVAALAPVAGVEVGRDWPGTLVIEVVERTPVAAVPTVDGGFHLLDGDGVVFHTVAAAPARLPTVVLAALTPPLREQLDVLTVASPDAIELSLTSGVTVLWGDASASGEKARVATALLDHETLPEHDGVSIDVSAPEVVAVR